MPVDIHQNKRVRIETDNQVRKAGLAKAKRKITGRGKGFQSLMQKKFLQANIRHVQKVEACLMHPYRRDAALMGRVHSDPHVGS